LLTSFIPGYRCIITKVVHVQIVLSMTAAQFSANQEHYRAAVAAAAQVDLSMVSIQGWFTVSNPPLGRRLLSHRRGAWDSRAVEIHTVIHQSHMVRLTDLDSHLKNHGLPRSQSTSLTMHSEVVQTYRH
jgi:hypothetical protein